MATPSREQLFWVFGCNTPFHFFLELGNVLHDHNSSLQDQISLPLQHIKWHAQHILNNTNPADDDDEITLKLQTMKPLAKILNVRAPLERIGLL